jgi:hypothetical protein
MIGFVFFVGHARVVRFENASHDLVVSNQSDVLREMDDFIKNLPKPGALR